MRKNMVRIGSTVPNWKRTLYILWVVQFMTTVAMIAGMIPVVLAFTYYLFDFFLWQKLAISLLIMSLD